MKRILVYVDTDGTRVRRSSLEVLSQARQLSGGDVDALLLSPDPAPFLAELARYGAARCLCVTSPAFAAPLNAALVAGLAAGIGASEPAVVAMASTERVKDVLGALAARLQATAVPDVADFKLTDDGIEAVRPVMAAKQHARVRASGVPVLVSVRSGSFQATEYAAPGQRVDVPFAWEAPGLSATLREIIGAAGGAVDLNEAQVVVAAGRGIRDEAGRQMVQDLADTLGAAIGASRAVVETGLFPATAQIGQTGKVVSPELYFALGISGAIQHTAGMSNSRVIVAVNKDADAPIFKMATYGLVGDVYKIVPALTAAIKAHLASR